MREADSNDFLQAAPWGGGLPERVARVIDEFAVKQRKVEEPVLWAEPKPAKPRDLDHARPSDRAPYSTRLRMLILLSVASWALLLFAIVSLLGLF